MQTHQTLGQNLNLFFMDETSPGSIFWKPRGTLIYNRLIEYIRYLYDIYEYEEVISPNNYDKSLWITSGHWEKYKENMFLLKSKFDEGDDEETGNKKKFSQKPMNCAGHCLIFRELRPMRKDLPIRLAEFGVLHRNELSGALHGLLRVRRFQQDDSHIFCGMDHLHKEILSVLEMIKKTYAMFDMKFKIYLSTRPEKYIGNIEVWNKAEEILRGVIQEFNGGKKILIKEGDGAFYGPKIDIAVLDSLKRENQCGTIQLDFNLPSPERFNLKYIDEDQHAHHPIIIHRAILGSLERFIGILLEHSQGRLPLWLSPYQIGVVTVHPEFNEAAKLFAKSLNQVLKETNKSVKVEFDDSNDDIRIKVKRMEKLKYNHIITIGKKEIDERVYAIRSNKKVESYNYDEMIELFKKALTY